MVDVESLVRYVGRQGRHRFVLGTIRGRDGAGKNQTAIDVRGKVTLALESHGCFTSNERPFAYERGGGEEGRPATRMWQTDV